MHDSSLHIDCIEPLDVQLGVDAPKLVPDALSDRLFGPSQAPIYAILDAAKVAHLPEELANSGLHHRCLFKDQAFDDYKDVAPWLVRLEADHLFTRNLFTQSDAPWHLWGKAPGIFVQSSSPFDAIWAHFRKFTKVRNGQGKWFYFRFWEPDFVAGLLERGDAETTARVRAIGAIMTCDATAARLTIFPQSVRDDTAPKTAFTLQDADIRALEDVSTRRFARRLSAWIISRYEGAPSAAEMESVAYQGIRQAQDVLGLRDEKSLADYVAASWLLGQPVETHYDLRNVPNLGHVLSVVHAEAGKFR